MTKKTTEQFKKELFDKYGVTLTSEYLGAHAKVSFKCINGHSLEASATNLLQRGYKCKECIHGRKIDSKIHWDTSKLEQLQQYINLGVSTGEIAHKFNTTISAINNTIADNTFTKPREIATLNVLIDKLLLQGRELSFEEGFYGANSNATITCSNGHTVSQSVGNILHHNTGCPKCFHALGKSKGESSLVSFIKENYSGWIIENDRSILAGKELDIVLPDIGISIEYNGGYWHSEHKVTSTYHLNKTEDVESFGYRLIHVHEYHWINKSEIVKSRLLNLLGKSTKLYARKCIGKRLDYFPKEFLNNNHLQGAGSPTGINYGLFYDNTLVAVMTFTKSRFRREYTHELVRYASILNMTIIGGASKLLKMFEKEVLPESLVSYAARDYSNGNLYYTLGFDLIDKTQPGYAYTKRGDSTEFSRHSFKKSMLEAKLPVYDSRLSEQENMAANGYYKIYDSGNLVFGKQYLSI
jgi:hypothetical protein